MKRVWLTILSLIFLESGLLGLTTASGGEYDQGKALYEKKCQICHGANGKGDGPAASTLSTQPMNFRDPGFWQGDVDRTIASTIRNGLFPMPAFNLSDDEIKAIIGYMSHTFK